MTKHLAKHWCAEVKQTKEKTGIKYRFSPSSEQYNPVMTITRTLSLYKAAKKT
ncbi:MAG: hypothetical protein KAV40_02840 [Thermoplasmatales archaeon]|nr:hypothetical protein [Thermoplasmatales archaeon]